MLFKAMTRGTSQGDQGAEEVQVWPQEQAKVQDATEHHHQNDTLSGYLMMSTGVCGVVLSKEIRLQTSMHMMIPVW